MRKNISKSSELVLFARVAREIGFSPATAEALASAGEFLPPIWVGNRRYLFRRDVDAWLATKRAESAGCGSAAAA